MVWDIFLSFAREDESDFAMPLTLALSSLGIQVWYDQEALVLGAPLREMMRRGIIASRFGVALLTPRYFQESKQDSTLFEMDLFLERQRREEGFLLPIVCEFLPEEILIGKYAPVKNILFKNWAQGFDAVIQALVRCVQPDLLPATRSNTVSLLPPLPRKQAHAVAMIRSYQGEARYLEAAHLALRYLSQNPFDPNIVKLYLSCAEATNNQFEVSLATGFVHNWLKEHPEDSGVRDKFILFVRERNRSAIKTVVDDLSCWLVQYANRNVRAGYLALVAREGSDAQVDRAITEGRYWLQQDDDSLVRVPYFILVMRRSDPMGRDICLSETAAWLANHPEDHDVRVVYAKELASDPNPVKRRDAIDNGFNWLQAHPDDNFFLPVYLDLVQKNGEPTYIDQALEFVDRLLKDPKRQPDTRVWEKYIAMVRAVGSSDQKRKAILSLKGLLVEESGKKTSNIRISLFKLMEQAGTTEEVQEILAENLNWLGHCEENTNVRAALLDLVKARLNSFESREHIVSLYREWLKEHQTTAEAEEVRRRFIDYVTDCGSEEQKQMVIHDTEVWLDGHKKVGKVKAALWRLRKCTPTPGDQA